MDLEPDDPLLDSLLDEVLAGRTPPDLTARISQAYAARQYGEQTPEPPPVLSGVHQAFAPTTSAPALQTYAKQNGRQRRSEAWSTPMTIGVAAAVVGLAVTIGLVVVLRTSTPQIARNVKPLQAAPAPAPRAIVVQPQKPTVETKRAAAPAHSVPVAPQVAPQIVQKTAPEPAQKISSEPSSKPQQPSESAIATAPAPRRERN